MAYNKSNTCVALMCGHGTQTNGSPDPGCVYRYNGRTYTEAGLMLPITKEAVKYLRHKGVHVLTDADHNNNRNMISDTSWANGYEKYKVICYVSLHCDFSGAPKGTQPLYISKAGLALAKSIDKEVRKSTNMTRRCYTRRKDLYELKATDMTAVIFETGSIKNDLSRLKDYKAYGRAIGRGIYKKYYA